MSKQKALELFAVMSGFIEFSDEMSPQDKSNALWNIFEENSKKMGLEVSREQLEEWMQEEMNKIYKIMESDNSHLKGLFSSDDSLKIVSLDPKIISNEPLQDIIVKVNNFKLGENND